MSVHALESVLYDLGVKREARKQFAEDADAFLARYRLSEAERTMVKTFDVAGLQGEGVNAMLTMGFWQMCEPSRSLASYMQRLKGGQ